MKHVLLAVGCDRYEQLSPLGKGESDARSVLESLVKPGDASSYDAESSKLLLSPTLAELQAALSQLDLSSDDTFTFFFAGHGHVRSGAFHMCVRDTRVDRITTTAYQLNNLLSYVQEVRPRQANIVIDACESGGVVGDIGRALNPEIIGNSGSTGITLLAACAKDQAAYETQDGGRCTTALVRCLSGEDFVQDVTEELDLLEVARQVAVRLQAQGHQTPTYWGLNLTGHPRFCANPHFSAESPFRQALVGSSGLMLPRASRDRLWSLLQNARESFDSREAWDALAEAVENARTPEEAALLIRQLSISLSTAIGADSFRKIEVSATALCTLIGLSRASSNVQDFIDRECEVLSDEVFVELRRLLDQLATNQFVLVGDSGLGELFALPVRITRVLGWAGFALRVAPSDAHRKIVKELIAFVVEKYALSVKAISDEQAPALAIAAAGLLGVGLHEELEALAGLLFNSLYGSNGSVAAVQLSPSRVIEFLEATRAKKWERGRDLFAIPSQLVFVLLLIAAKLNLDDVVDPDMKDLDHVAINAFIPASYEEFGLQRIESGINATYRIGHDLWTVADFRKIWSSVALPKSTNTSIERLSILCSLIFPDRVAWHSLG